MAIVRGTKGQGTQGTQDNSIRLARYPLDCLSSLRPGDIFNVSSKNKVYDVRPPNSFMLFRDF